MILLGRKIVGARGRLTVDDKPIMRRYGIYRERIGPKGGMTVVGLWPFVVAVSARKPNGERWRRG
jgi:hypothetical protein